MPEQTKPRRPCAAANGRGPGPIYQLRDVVGYPDHCPSKRRMPAYSFSGKGHEFSNDASPGPKYAIGQGWTNKGPDGAPKVGISGRHQDLTSFQTPSPDKYSVDAAGRQVYHNAPAASMGIRHRQAKTDNTPGPNNYSMPAPSVYKKKAPEPSLRSRPAVGGFGEDLQKTPGPGTYKTTDPNAYKNRSPGYSVLGRNELPGDSTQKPGPGAHKPENVYVNSKKMPAFSFGIRHSEYTAPLIVECADD